MRQIERRLEVLEAQVSTNGNGHQGTNDILRGLDAAIRAASLEELLDWLEAEAGRQDWPDWVEMVQDWRDFILLKDDPGCKAVWKRDEAARPYFAGCVDQVKAGKYSKICRKWNWWAGYWNGHSLPPQLLDGLGIAPAWERPLRNT